MAGSQGKSEFWKLMATFGLMLIILAIFIGISSANQNKCKDPCPSGNTEPQIANPADPQIQDLLSSLAAYKDPAAFLAANAIQLDALRAKLVQLKTDIAAKKASLASLNSEAVAPLLDKLITELDGIRTKISAKDDKTKQERSQLATQFMADIRTLNSLLPSGALACADGGKCLNVPAIDQRLGMWCGGTSMVEMLLYYSKGANTGPVAGHFETGKSGRLVSVNASSSFLTPGHLNSASGHGDWDRANKPASVDAMWSMLTKSIDAGDPVILYTDGTFYPQFTRSGRRKTYGHIVVVMGYKQQGRILYVNNSRTPEQGGTIKATGFGINKTPLTAEFVYSTLGQPVYGHSFVIRKAYL